MSKLSDEINQWLAAAHLLAGLFSDCYSVSWFVYTIVPTAVAEALRKACLLITSFMLVELAVGLHGPMPWCW